MALILCPECNAQVSHQAEHCPHCGFPIRQYCAGQVQPNAEPAPQAPEPAEPHIINPEPPASGNTPEPPRNKGNERLMIGLMLLVVIVIAAYFAVPYFTGTTPSDHEVIVGDSINTPSTTEDIIDTPAPPKKEEAKPQEEETEPAKAEEPTEAPSQRRDTTARPWIKMEPAKLPTAKPANTPKTEEGNAEKKAE